VDNPLLLLGAGFVLTTVGGGTLGYYLQQRAWRQQTTNQRSERDLEAATKTFEEVSVLLDRRLYRMRRVYWLARRLAPAPGDTRNLSSALLEYRSVVENWNDNLNRLLALIQTYFGRPMRERLQSELYDTYAAVGEELDQFVREVSVTKRGSVRVRPVGRRLTDLSHRVFAFNLLLLTALEHERVGRNCDNRSEVPWRPLPVRFGVDTRDVGAVQRALRDAGADGLLVDSHFGLDTDDALRDFQRRHTLAPDGVAGPQTLQALGLAGGTRAPASNTATAIGG
jgi:murein L,D-transpeptidase YcbB/YkuD